MALLKTLKEKLHKKNTIIIKTASYKCRHKYGNIKNGNKRNVIVKIV
jgi:hypothetical protein